MKERKFERVRNLCVDVQPDQGRVRQTGLCEIDQEFRQRGREQNGLSILGKSAENFAQLLAETHFEKSEKKILFFNYSLKVRTTLNCVKKNNLYNLKVE